MSRMLERSTNCNFKIDCGEGHDTADCETCVVVAAVERFSPVTLPRNEQVGVWEAVPVPGCSVAVFHWFYLAVSSQPKFLSLSLVCKIKYQSKFLQFVLIGM